MRIIYVGFDQAKNFVDRPIAALQVPAIAHANRSQVRDKDAPPSPAACCLAVSLYRLRL